jgi:multiple sugar transport system substrate-binding protein
MRAMTSGITNGRARRTRRTTLLGAAAALPAAALAACSAGGSGGPPSTVGTRVVTLRWTTWQAAGAPMVEASAKGAALFMQKFPKIKVNPEPDPGAEKLFAEMVAGTAPDLMSNCCAVLPTWAQKGLLTNLDPLVKRDWKDSLVKDFSEVQYNYFWSKEAGRFAVPMYMGTSALYYNKDRFQKAGVAFPDDTWDMAKLQDAMRRLTQPTQEQWGFYPRISRGTRNFLVNGGGGNIVDPKDDTRAAFDQAPALAVFQWLRDRTWQDNTAIQRAQEQGNSREMLARGRVAMIIEGSFELQTVLRAGPDVNWDLALIPKGFKERRNRATVDGWVIWKEAKNKDESWALVSFLQSDEWWEINMPITGQQPTRISLQAKYPDVLRRSHPTFASKNMNVFTHPIINKYVGPQENWRLDDQAAPIYEKAWTDAVVDNKVAVSDAFRQAAVEIANLHKQQLGK